MRCLAVLVVLLLACACRPPEVEEVAAVPPSTSAPAPAEVSAGDTTTTRHTSVTTTAPRTRAASTPTTARHWPGRSELLTPTTTARPGRRVSSTAYCLTGRMANGQHTHRAAVASNDYPLGTRLRVSDSPYGPGVFTVEDRIGHGTQLDFAIPGDCAGARRWGRRAVVEARA